MGQEHFKQMYADALALDCQAMPIFMDMVITEPDERKLYGRGFWESLPVDVIMDKARKLVPLGQQFHLDMKHLLVDGTTRVMFVDQHGKLHKVRDPDVIDFDDAILHSQAFFHLMMTCPTEFCSGDQNV